MRMGTVINFPPVERTARTPRVVAGKRKSATVVILPVIRIERYTEAPAGYSAIEVSSTQRRRRRRRSARA
jgi:hypothetical protein